MINMNTLCHQCLTSELDRNEKLARNRLSLINRVNRRCYNYHWLTLCIQIDCSSGLIHQLGIVHCTYLGVPGYNFHKLLSSFVQRSFLPLQTL